MELRKEYEAIAQQFASSIEAHDRVRNAVTACQELADRPPRELTASEKYELWLSVYDGMFGSTRRTNGSEVIDKIIAAILEKQREPQVVKFRAARYKTGQRIEMFSDLPNEHWEWLDADGKAQEFEVRI